VESAAASTSWAERRLLVLVRQEGRQPTRDAQRGYLSDSIANGKCVVPGTYVVGRMVLIGPQQKTATCNLLKTKLPRAFRPTTSIPTRGRGRRTANAGSRNLSMRPFALPRAIVLCERPPSAAAVVGTLVR